MAIQTWMTRQDRDGLHLSPVFAVPPGKAAVQVTLTEVGFTNVAQDIALKLRASYNARSSYEDSGAVNFRGGTYLDKLGNPLVRTLKTNLNPENYPTHMQVEMLVAGSVNCGVDVEFLDTP